MQQTAQFKKSFAESLRQNQDLRKSIEDIEVLE